mmetsp:Transcript_38097/g.81172  ORF Transcript_38097/g.81172 Transcript_38097/m.81172 type:complete len:207 (-) Transcript_38097:350-970(-)
MSQVAVPLRSLLDERVAQQLRVVQELGAEVDDLVVLLLHGLGVGVHGSDGRLVELDPSALLDLLRVQLLQLLRGEHELRVCQLDLLLIAQVLVELDLEPLRLLLEKVADEVHPREGLGTHGGRAQRCAGRCVRQRVDEERRWGRRRCDRRAGGDGGGYPCPGRQQGAKRRVAVGVARGRRPYRPRRRAALPRRQAPAVGRQCGRQR